MEDLKKNRDELLAQKPGTGTMVQTRTRYTTAVSVQKPRDIDKIIVAVEREAQYAGENFYYGWGEGNDRVEGPSVGLALCVAREWGNCVVEPEFNETDDAFLFTGHFIDLETGFTISRSFRQSKKSTVYGKMDANRKEDTRYQIGQSKCLRNVVKAAMPAWLLKKAIEKAKQAVLYNISHEGIHIALDKALCFLKRHGVEEDRVLAKIGRKKAEITNEDVADIRTACAAIDNGESTTEECFPKIQKDIKKPEAKKPQEPESAKTVNPEDQKKAFDSYTIAIDGFRENSAVGKLSTYWLKNYKEMKRSCPDNYRDLLEHKKSVIKHIEKKEPVVENETDDGSGGAPDNMIYCKRNDKQVVIDECPECDKVLSCAEYTTAMKDK